MVLESIGLALMIFCLRVLNNTIGTMRIVVLNRDQKSVAFVLALIEPLIFAMVLGTVISDLTNILNLFAYCTGFAVGGYLGQTLEAHFIASFITANIVLKDEEGEELATKLREAGYGVTATQGTGISGTVTMLRSVITRKDATKFVNLVRNISPEAFITTEEARSVHRGWIRAARVSR